MIFGVNRVHRSASLLLTLVACLIMACGAVSLAHAQETPRTRSLSVVPSEEKRSRIVDVVGETPIPQGQLGARTPAQNEALRDAAVTTAKKQALARVVTELGSDAALGVRPDRGLDDVYVLNTTDMPVENGRYSLVVRVEVRLYPRTVLSADQPATAQDPLTVSIRTDRRDYKDGEDVIVYVKGNKDFYGRITYEDASGAIIQVLPNLYRDDAKFLAGGEYRIPGDGDRFRLRVNSPFGRERFTVFASTRELGETPTKAVDGGSGLRAAEGDRQTVANRTRGLSVIEVPKAAVTPSTSNPSGAPRGSADFFEATWEITTHATNQVAAPAPTPPAPVAAPKPKPIQAAKPTPAKPVDIDLSYDSRIPTECSLRLGRDLLKSINALKPIKNSNVEVLDLRNLTTISSGGTEGLVCGATLHANDGSLVPARIRLFISQLGELLIELKTTS